MEPEDLPWPGELEEEAEGAEVTEEVAEETEEAEVPEEAESLDEDEVVMVEDVEDEEGRDLDADLNYESQPRESTDDEDDEEAEAWLQAHPGRPLPLPSFPQYRYFEGERTGLEKVSLGGERCGTPSGRVTAWAASCSPPVTMPDRYYKCA